MSGMITTCVRGRTIDRSADKKIYGPGERHGRVDTRVIVWLFAEGVRGCGGGAHKYSGMVWGWARGPGCLGSKMAEALFPDGIPIIVQFPDGVTCEFIFDVTMFADFILAYVEDFPEYINGEIDFWLRLW